MLNSQETSESGIHELNRTINDYKAKLDDIAKKEKERLRQLYEKEAIIIINGAWQKAEEIIAESQQEAKVNRERTQNQAKKEASEIIDSARQKAQQIIAEAEMRDRKEARSRTRAEVEKIIARANEESNIIITGARMAAEKEAKEIASRSREEAERLLKEEITTYRKDAQAQFIHAIAEAHTRAKTMIDDITGSSAEISESILKVIEDTETVVAGFKSGLQTELSEIARIITAARKKAEQVTSETVGSSTNMSAIPEADKKDALSLPSMDGKSGIETLSSLFAKGRQG